MLTSCPKSNHEIEKTCSYIEEIRKILSHVKLYNGKIGTGKVEI